MTTKPSLPAALGAAVAAMTILGFALGAGASAPNHGTPPAIPNLQTTHTMILSGSTGKPIIGKNGQPIVIPVGVPALPPAPPRQEPLSGSQIVTSEKAGAAVITIPRESDAQKARRLAPDQAR